MKRTTKYVAFDVHQATTVASVRNRAMQNGTPITTLPRSGLVQRVLGRTGISRPHHLEHEPAKPSSEISSSPC